MKDKRYTFIDDYGQGTTNKVLDINIFIVSKIL